MALASCPTLLEEEQRGGNKWYFSRSQIEENSPSRKDGIDWKKETDFPKSYCSFLRELGTKIKVPQTVIATATVFCHRFFIRKSHAKYDCFEIATSCFLLALKGTEGYDIPVKAVIAVSSEILARKNSFEILELSLGSKTLVLHTLNFDVLVKHPYEPLNEAMRGFQSLPERENLATVAQKFIDDAFETILCLQFRPRQIAAGPVYSAAELLKIELHSESDERQRICWWHKFGATLLELEEIRKQMFENLKERRISKCRVTVDEKPPSLMIENSGRSMDHTLNAAAHEKLLTTAAAAAKKKSKASTEKQKTSNEELVNFGKKKSHTVAVVKKNAKGIPTTTAAKKNDKAAMVKQKTSKEVTLGKRKKSDTGAGAVVPQKRCVKTNRNWFMEIEMN